MGLTVILVTVNIVYFNILDSLMFQIVSCIHPEVITYNDTMLPWARLLLYLTNSFLQSSKFLNHIAELESTKCFFSKSYYELFQPKYSWPIAPLQIPKLLIVPFLYILIPQGPQIVNMKSQVLDQTVVLSH